MRRSPTVVTRLILLVVTSGLFAAAWAGDTPGKAVAGVVCRSYPLRPGRAGTQFAMIPASLQGRTWAPPVSGSPQAEAKGVTPRACGAEQMAQSGPRPH